MKHRERFIDGKKYPDRGGEPLPERSQIAIELACRLHELHEIDPQAAVSFLQLMVKLYRIDPWVYHLTLTILAGNPDAGKSLAVIGHESCVSKQHVHQQQNRALELLQLHHPRVAETIRDIIQRTKPTEAAGAKSSC